MLLRREAWPFIVAIAVTLAVVLSHLGLRTGCHQSSRPDCGGRFDFTVPADGYIFLYDGLPTPADCGAPIALAELFRGEAGSVAAGINDERPLPSFLLALVDGVGMLLGAYLLNTAFTLVAVAAAVDLGLRSGRGPLFAVACGCLIGATRGIGFYVGVPDAHLIAFACFPIGVWLHERLGLAAPEAPPENAWIFGLFVGMALLTYLGDLALLGFFWLNGLGRVPWRRLVVATAVALLVLFGWRAAGSFAGLPFSPFATHSIPQGLSYLGRASRSAFVTAWASQPQGSFGVLETARLHLNSLLVALREFLPGGSVGSILFEAIVPGFGLPLLVLAALGLLEGSWRERRYVLALFIPPIVAGWPMNVGYDAPRMSYGAFVGVAWAGALGLVGLSRMARQAAERLREGETWGRAVEIVAVVVPLAALLAYESSDLFGKPVVFRQLHMGQ